MDSLPWARPRFELALLVLVAFTALTPVYVLSSQDISRLCLARSVLTGHLTIGACAGHEVDRARRAGHIYSDKAPGMSLLAVPVEATIGTHAGSSWSYTENIRVWLARLSTSGLAFLVLAACLGRVSEGLAPGTGGFVLVATSLATLLGPLSATMFDQDAAAAFGFVAFLLMWRRRSGSAGLLAGFAVFVEYQSALIALAVGIGIASVSLRSRQPAPISRYVAGLTPGAILLGAYDWLAFGSPLHPSYRYVANKFAREQAQGLFGIGSPNWHSIDLTLLHDRGLLVCCPVLLAAAYGLLLFARRHPREGLVASGIVVAYLFLCFGYFLPYGGISPGPRFFVPALPFLALGLGPAVRRLPVPTIALAAVSLVAGLTLELTWTRVGLSGYRGSLWQELLRSLTHVHSRLRSDLAANILSRLGASRGESAALVVAAGAAALALSLVALRRGHVRPGPVRNATP